LTVESFHALGVSAEVSQALAAHDIVVPFPIQAVVVPAALAGGDVLAKSPTGSGKTLAFGVPIVDRISSEAGAPAALILVPTRELAGQVTEALRPIAKAKGLRVEAAYGGTPVHKGAKRIKGAHVLVATPGRLFDLIERRLVKLHQVSILVLDEADRMLDMGFKPQVDRIVRHVPKARQTMFFSATLDATVGELAGAYTSNPVRCEAAPIATEDQGEVEHHFVSVKPDDKVGTLAELLRGDRGLALVFVRTKRGADRLVKKLAFHQVDAVALHGDLSQGQRERALRRFETGKASTLVATDVAARGLDLADITHVINFDPPAEHSGYLHRVGRTGRAGRGGVGITLVLPDQQADVSRVARLAGHTEQFASGGMTVAPPRRVYSSRRGRSKWGSPAPRRKI
jgi:ATP-dependent RNA helicase RhlE